MKRNCFFFRFHEKANFIIFSEKFEKFRQDFHEHFRFRFVSTLLASRGEHLAGENPNHTTAKQRGILPFTAL
jgi:hypothetical protein